jgi:hypothetical protein
MRRQITKTASIMLGAMLVAACSSSKLPAKWEELGVSKEGLVKVESETDQNGLYLEYRGRSRESILDSATQSLTGAGYKKIGVAFDGEVLGFEKEKDQLAVKVDQFGDSFYLAIFNEHGKEPLLHGVVFGKYTLGPKVSGDEAKQQLLKELTSDTKPQLDTDESVQPVVTKDNAQGQRHN